jgi:hypothetical protein
VHDDPPPALVAWDFSSTETQEDVLEREPLLRTFATFFADEIDRERGDVLLAETLVGHGVDPVIARKKVSLLAWQLRAVREQELWK